MSQQIVQRLLRMIKFDQTVYKEIEEDEKANTEALVVVLVAAFLAFLGSLIAGAGIGSTLVGFVSAVLIGWLLWSYVTLLIGTRLFAGEAEFWEMARLIGYASAPGALGFLAWIPCLGLIASLVGWVLSLVISFFAIREGLDLPTDKTIITVVIGWVVMVVINLAIVAVLGVGFALF